MIHSWTTYVHYFGSLQPQVQCIHVVLSLSLADIHAFPKEFMCWSWSPKGCSTNQSNGPPNNSTSHNDAIANTFSVDTRSRGDGWHKFPVSTCPCCLSSTLSSPRATSFVGQSVGIKSEDFIINNNNNVIEAHLQSAAMAVFGNCEWLFFLHHNLS